MQTDHFYNPTPSNADDRARAPVDDNSELTRGEVEGIIDEIAMQPHWRKRAADELEYADGNQLDSDLLKKQEKMGIPPAVENIIAPTLEGICGFEAKTRTDWRITPEGGAGGQDVADALKFKMNQAERQSRADKACSDAFYPQLAVGMGWVEVRRESDPTKYPYACEAVDLDEIWWDMSNRNDKRLLKARWLLRKRWMDPAPLALTFPTHAARIRALKGSNLSEWYHTYALGDSDTTTDLTDGGGYTRGWGLSEAEWFNPEFKKVAVYEIWYRRWVRATFIKTPDGRVVEYDPRKVAHVLAIASGQTKPQTATVARLRRAYWMGPLQLHDGFTPYAHPYFPYVPFWNKREKKTGVPYGALRAMIYPQETLNSGIGKMRWGMSAVTTTRTKGAFAGTDQEFREKSGRVDADFVLSLEHMAEPGAVFKRERDYQLTEQHYKMIEDARNSIERVGPGSSGFLGKEGTATSGIQEQAQIDQSTQRLGGLMDEFKEGRTVCGEILLSLLIEDIGKEPEAVVIEGDAIRPERTVQLNVQVIDPDTGLPYLSNDVMRTRLKVALEDVPSTSSFRAQQLAAATEVTKSLPAEMQVAMTPFVVALMDLPYKREVIEALRAAQSQTSEEQIQQRIDQAVKDAGLELKRQELEMRYGPDMMAAQLRKVLAETFKLQNTALYEANQTALTLAQNPAAAPLADHVAKIAGFVPAPGGTDPNFPVAGLPQPVQAVMPPAPPPGGQPNTNPTQPAGPPQPAGPGTGIETQEAGDGVTSAGDEFPQ